MLQTGQIKALAFITQHTLEIKLAWRPFHACVDYTIFSQTQNRHVQKDIICCGETYVDTINITSGKHMLTVNAGINALLET